MKKRLLSLLLIAVLLVFPVGCGDPEDGIAMGEFLDLVSDTFGMVPRQTEQPYFDGIRPGDPYFDSVQACAEWGILDELPDLSLPVDNADLALILTRAANVTEANGAFVFNSGKNEEAVTLAVGSGLLHATFGKLGFLLYRAPVSAEHAADAAEHAFELWQVNRVRDAALAFTTIEDVDLEHMVPADAYSPVDMMEAVAVTDDSIPFEEGKIYLFETAAEPLALRVSSIRPGKDYRLLTVETAELNEVIRTLQYGARQSVKVTDTTLETPDGEWIDLSQDELPGFTIRVGDELLSVGLLVDEEENTLQFRLAGTISRIETHLSPAANQLEPERVPLSVEINYLLSDLETATVVEHDSAIDSNAKGLAELYSAVSYDEAYTVQLHRTMHLGNSLLPDDPSDDAKLRERLDQAEALFAESGETEETTLALGTLRWQEGLFYYKTQINLVLNGTGDLSYSIRQSRTEGIDYEDGNLRWIHDGEVDGREIAVSFSGTALAENSHTLGFLAWDLVDVYARGGVSFHSSVNYAVSAANGVIRRDNSNLPAAEAEAVANDARAAGRNAQWCADISCRPVLEIGLGSRRSLLGEAIDLFDNRAAISFFDPETATVPLGHWENGESVPACTMDDFS